MSYILHMLHGAHELEAFGKQWGLEINAEIRMAYTLQQFGEQCSVLMYVDALSTFHAGPNKKPPFGICIIAFDTSGEAPVIMQWQAQADNTFFGNVALLDRVYRRFQDTLRQAGVGVNPEQALAILSGMLAGMLIMRVI